MPFPVRKSHQKAEVVQKPWLPYPGEEGIEYRRFAGGWESRCARCRIATRQHTADPDPLHSKGCPEYSLTCHPCGAPRTKKDVERQGEIR